MKMLDMSNRGLTELPKGVNYDEYDIVYLNSNQLKTIPENAFLNAKHVYLSNNFLETIPETALPNAKIVDLEDNQITAISENAFMKASVVDLRCNRLTSIPKSAFPKAKFVYLCNNQLESYIVKYQGYYDVYAWGHRIMIGCKLHTIEEWENFTDDEIDAMHKKALKFWREYKSDILKMAKNML